ncbi:MAG TPA: DUF480 domain-containing protein [Elusimicrobia bacterium]|nr:DUF480 domain-containing protein [Elusimicrobiota bacterium]HBT61779.1 DUF480 domain-containing protein [Elusimicrobiota bacterium]
MPDPLTAIEARILGSLVEKSLTTPELYPLSLNSLVNACNQKSNRDPVMNLGHAEVEKALAGLVERKFAARVYEAGARAVKYSHHIEVLLGSEDPKVIGVVCVLLLRGPQTPGEIKARTERLCRLESIPEVETLMRELSNRVDGAIISRLTRQPGQKEARYRQLFTNTEPAPEPAAAPAQPPPDRLAQLEARVAALEAAVRELRAGPASPPN